MDLCDVIKEIRAELGLSQEAFAQKLHVHFSTVNRWENGHARPNPLAIAMLNNLCNEATVRKALVKALAEETKH